VATKQQVDRAAKEAVDETFSRIEQKLDEIVERLEVALPELKARIDALEKAQDAKGGES
jgi:hypothetical protein